MSQNEHHSEETKLKMAEVLKELVKEKPFSKITVGEIVEKCRINRNTFYYHFENTHDLLFWVYNQEIKNIISSYQNANATLPQAMVFILDYIDQNKSFIDTVIESLGEKDLVNLFERNLRELTAGLLEYYLQKNSLTVSEDFLSFLVFNYTSVLSTQIIWYMKYNDSLDRKKFLSYLETAASVSMEASLKAGALKGL